MEFIKDLVEVYAPAVEEGEEGQGMVEYGLILVLVSIVAIAALILVGDNLFEVFSDIGDRLGGAGDD